MLVKLIDGSRFADVFVDQSSRHIIFQEYGRVARDRIKKMSPYIEQGYVWISTRSAEEFDTKQSREFPNLCPLRKWNHSQGVYETCSQNLDAKGCCPEHKQVRFSPHEAAKDAKERQKSDPVTLRKEPPRRSPGGRTTARRMHTRRVMGW